MYYYVASVFIVIFILCEYEIEKFGHTSHYFVFFFRILYNFLLIPWDNSLNTSSDLKTMVNEVTFSLHL